MLKIKKLNKKLKTLLSTKNRKIAASALISIALVSSFMLYTRYSEEDSTAYANPSPAKVLDNKNSGGNPKAGQGAAGAAADNAAKATAAAAAANTAKAKLNAARAAAAAKPVTPAKAVPAGLSLYADPAGNVASQAVAWGNANPGDAAKMNRLASTPMASWFGEWSGNVQSATANYVGRAANAGKLPVLVAYNIPNRDCGSYSAGGAASAESYKAWISQFAAGIGQRQAIVIIEPDGLSYMDCLDAAGQQNRLQLLAFAVQTLHAQTKSAIYIDAGNSNWHPASVIADRLKSANVAEATGFSLNVSNFYTASSNAGFGASVSKLVGGKHFVIDTGRSGNGATSGDLHWCNPTGRAFGNQPTLQTGNSLVDAYLWVKSPGESDGSCGPAQQGTAAPPAGTWWPQYALMLQNNSGW